MGEWGRVSGAWEHLHIQGGISVKEVLKISCHLLTYATDFDPTNKSQAQVFALARADD